LTGCYPNRIGIHRALSPSARNGLPASEETLAELLKRKGYATAIVGKWHLGHKPEFLPTRRGFDCWFGLPYSHDMWPGYPDRTVHFPPLPLMEGEKVVNPDLTEADLKQLTPLYTDRAVQFIEKNKDRPFFLYLAHSYPHVPLFAGDNFKGRSKRGLYGDVVEELDWSVARLLATLKQHGLESRTLVLFTSDNGPWLRYGEHSGSAGGLREGKATVYEGGVRIPFVAMLPGRIPSGSIQREPAMNIDLLPTIVRLVGAPQPQKKIDGLDIWPLFLCEKGARNPHEAYDFYFGDNELQAVRSGKWKLILPHRVDQVVEGHEVARGGIPGEIHQQEVQHELYDLETDRGESRNVYRLNPAVAKKLSKYAEKARKELGDALTKRAGTGTRNPSATGH